MYLPFINGVDVKVAGLNSAAYETKESFDNAIADAKKAVLGDPENDTAESITVHGVKKKAEANATAIASLKSATDVVKNVTVNGVDATVSNNKATVTIGGANIALTGYNAPTGGTIKATNTVNQAINILEDQLIWHEAN